MLDHLLNYIQTNVLIASLIVVASLGFGIVMARSGILGRLYENRAVTRIRILNWLSRNYIWLFITVGAVAISWAFLTYVHKLPALITETIDGLDAVYSNDPDAPDDQTAERIRNLAYGFGALAAALTIMATIPFQLIRVWLNERSARTAEQSHITDQINKAVEGLGAEKTVNRLGRTVRYTKDGVNYSYFEWKGKERETPEHDIAEDGPKLTNDPFSTVPVTEPNIEVRVGAIYALERISQDSPRDHVQIMEILTAYIRENSPAETAKPFVDIETGEEMPDWEPLVEDGNDDTRKAYIVARHERFGRDILQSKAWRWAQTLTARTDIQAAVQVLGRRDADQRAMERADRRYGPDGYRMDLRRTNLQAVDVSRLNFDRARFENSHLEGAILHETEMKGADLSWARMEGAYLSWARMEGAYLSGARMEGAYLSGARMEGADLSWARMEGAYLSGARMEGADLDSIRIDQSTDLRAETNRASALRSMDFTIVDVPEDFLKSAFGDGSVILPEGYTAGEGVLAHWHPDKLDWDAFEKAWRAWQDEIGYKRRD